MTRKTLAITLALAALGATTAMAAGGPNRPLRKAIPNTSTQEQCCSAAASTGNTSTQAPYVAPDGWVYGGGDSTWELGQHKYAFRDGKLAMAADCPVTIAKAKAAALSKE